MTYAVALIDELGIRAVLHIAQLVRLHIVVNVTATEVQQWPHDASVTHRNAMKTRYACAAQQVDEEGLNRIVAMMRRGRSGIALVFHQLIEIVVSQPTRSLLYRQAPLGGIGPRVEARHMYWHAIALCQPAHKSLVAVAVARA